MGTHNVMNIKFVYAWFAMYFPIPPSILTLSGSEHAEYLERFLADFERVLTSMIEKGIDERNKSAVNDPLSLECIAHAQFAKTKAQGFQGRADFLEDIRTKLNSDRWCRAPMV